MAVANTHMALQGPLTMKERRRTPFRPLSYEQQAAELVTLGFQPRDLLHDGTPIRLLMTEARRDE